MKTYSDHLQPVSENLWTSGNDENVSFPSVGYENCFALEDRSFWFLHRNACIVELVKNFRPPGPLFDIGGGNGFVTRALDQAGLSAVLVEPSLIAARNALSRGLKPVISSTFDGAHFKNQSLPAVGLFDVLEHIQDDMSFLHQLHHCLTPQGKIFCTVPAHPRLWSFEDEQAGHFRRYSLTSIKNRFLESGFRVLYATPFFSILPIPIFLFRSLPTRLGLNRMVSDRISHTNLTPERLRSFMLRLLSYEITRVHSQKKMVWGSSFLLAAEKV